MAYVKSKTSIDAIAAAMGPLGNSPAVDGNGDADPAGYSSAPDTNNMKKALIDQLSQPKFVDDWASPAQKQLSIPEAIAKSLEERRQRGENTEADLNKDIVSYEYRHKRHWSEVDLEKMEEADSDDELLKKGKFLKW